LLGGDAGGDEPTEDTQFAQAAGDELGGLAAEVENGDDFDVGKFELSGGRLHGHEILVPKEEDR